MVAMPDPASSVPPPSVAPPGSPGAPAPAEPAGPQRLEVTLALEAARGGFRRARVSE